MDTEVILKRFEDPDETRVMTLGKFEIIEIGGITIGRATYQPGWRWSEHVGPGLGLKYCAGELFYIPPRPHDSWVVGDEPYVSLHFLGAEKYAK